VKRYLLDTNVISELRKPKPHGAVIAWLKSLREEQIFLSAVTLGELQAGIERARLQDPKKAIEIEVWVDQLAESIQVMPMDVACFREWGRLIYRKQDHLLEDAMIAATARVHGFVVATRNERDFEALEVAVTNPFENERPV
jgi:predicted nucleic acid-binding protein